MMCFDHHMVWSSICQLLLSAVVVSGHSVLCVHGVVTSGVVYSSGGLGGG